MSDRTLSLREIRLDRVLGIDRPGFVLSGLSQAVNLVYGPNGSGKTTTARVIQELLWPGQSGLDRPSASGWLQVDGDEWQIALDAGHPEITCNGRPGELPPCGPAEHAARYRLALHELVTTEDADFAAAIASASQGGYDVEAAADSLGFADTPSVPQGRIRELDSARQTLNEVRRRQEDLDGKVRSLQDLRRQLQEASEAKQRAGLLEFAQSYQQAAAERDLLLEQRKAFPPAVSKLRGDERERLDELAERRAKLERQRNDEENEIRHAQQKLTELGLPEEGVPDALLDNLSGQQKRLEEVEREKRQAEKDLAEARAAVASAQRRLGEHLTDVQLKALETVEIADLSALARQADQLRAARAAYEERGRQLEREKTDLGEAARFESSTVQRGLTALEDWLVSPPPIHRGQRVGWPVFAVAALAAVLASALAVLQHPAWAVGILGAIGLLFVERQRLRGAGETVADPRAMHRQTYDESGLPQPAAWDAQSVRALRRQLLAWAQAHTLEADRLRRWTEWSAAAAELEASEEQLQRKRADLEQRLGLKLAVTDQWLPLLVESLAQFHRNSAGAEAAGELVKALAGEGNELLARLNEGLAAVGHGAVESAEAASRALDRLRKQATEHQQARTAIEAARSRLENDVEPGLRTIADRRQELLARVGLEDDRGPQLDQWLAELPRYQKLVGKLKETDGVLNDRRGRLVGHETLADLSPNELEERLSQAQNVAARRDDLLREITEIEQNLKQAKQGHELSEALAASEAAEARLADARDENVAAAVGAAVARWVRQTAVEGSRPQVFRRANELLAKFTRYTLQVELDDDNGLPCFRGRSGEGPVRDLAELSGGERVQLLLAVRVAFLEQDETVKLPLLMDEVLGTSDDARASEIVDSVVALAREGRQIFYFTAQHDELGKWQARLEEECVENRVFDLARLRGLAAAESAPLTIAPVEVPAPPAPAGRSHADYGRALNVPGIDLAATTLDRLHLWHVVEDVELLHRLLCQQITTWGQLQLLLAHGGARSIPGLTEARPQVEAVAKAIAAACNAWQIGRGKPVDREALQDSGAVSDTFIDSVTALAAKQHGDARALLSALTAGEVPRWRATSTEKLAAYLAENGYLPHEDPLAPDEIRVRVQAAVARELSGSVLDRGSMDRVLAYTVEG